MTAGPRRVRIVRASTTTGAMRPLSLAPSAEQWRRMTREEVAGRLAAERIVREAQARADAIETAARADAANAAAQAAREAENRAEATIAARWIALRHEQGQRLERDTERVIAVAIVLAERLLGTALKLHPERIADLAHAAIAEARGAQQIVIEAHPLDAAALEEHLGKVGLDARSVEVRENEALAQGELRLQTDVGTIDAKLAPQLERLAAALRDALP